MTDSEHRHSAFLLIRELKRMGVYNKFIRNRENQRMHPLINSKNKIEKARLVDVATPLGYLYNFNCSAVSFCWFDSPEEAKFWSEISQKLRRRYYKYDMLLARKNGWLGNIKKIKFHEKKKKQILFRHKRGRCTRHFNT